MQNSNKKGFTLLELLIVIGIIAILSVVVILVLNPAETLKKSRDTQRMSDLATLKTALGLYLTVVPNPDLDASVANLCLGETDNVAAQISYSKEYTSATSCTADIVEGADVTPGSTFSTTDSCRNTLVSAATVTLVDGTGWVPVNFTGITGGSPIANLPLDPTNNLTDNDTTPTSTDLVYRYACQATTTGNLPRDVFEINTVLESAAYGPGGTDDKSTKDGGDNSGYYEVGTNVRLIGSGTNF